MSKVMIYPASYENLYQAVDRTFEIFPLEFHEKRVLIKPNLLRASDPEEGIVTHPAVVRSGYLGLKLRTLSSELKTSIRYVS